MQLKELFVAFSGHLFHAALEQRKLLGGKSVAQGLPFRTALRRITLKFLKRTIQDGEHDSIVDAKAALELFQLKLK